MLEIVKGAARKVADNEKLIVEMKPMMGAEDFSEYTALTKAAFATVGAGGQFPNHSDHVVFDEDSFRTGVALHCQVAYDYLTGANA